MEQRSALLVAAAFVGALMHGCAAPTPPPPSRVARVERVRTGIEEYDRFFRAVHAMQVSLNEAPRVERDIVSRLASAIGLEERADIEHTASRVHEQVLALVQDQSLRVIVETGGPADAIHDSSALDPADLVPTQTEAEAAIFVAIELRRGEPPSYVHVPMSDLPTESRTLLESVRTAIRSALALERRMDAIVAAAPALHALGVELRAEVPRHFHLQSAGAALRRELDDAIDFLDGAAARARVQALAARRLANRLRAATAVSAP